MFWGLTPALDLLDEYEKCGKIFPKSINILIVGGLDARHILKTVSKKFKHEKIILNFYIIEACLENIAKQLLLLTLALQKNDTLGLKQKTQIFMEIYGNTLIRPSVSKFLTSTAKELVKMITNYTYLHQLMPFINLEIKYKERDYLENLFKFWCGNDEFDITNYWDKRVRKLLGVRYDSKIGAFDWDLNMRFRCVGGSQVNGQEYKNFRTNGVAFTWLESEVSKPNRSMVCVVVQNGKNFAHYGYLGDIETGPFVAYGLVCDDKSYLKILNGVNAFRATDITERNLSQIFYEIENQNGGYVHKTTSDIQMGSIVMKTPDKLVVDIQTEIVINKKLEKCVHLDNVQVKFLSISTLNQMQYKEEYKDFFHLIYFGSNHLKFLNKNLVNNISKNNGSLLIVENKKFILSYRDKQLKDYQDCILEIVKDNVTKESLEKFDALKDDFATFITQFTS